MAFSRSRRFREVAGSYASEEGISEEEVDALVAWDLRELDPSYLEEKSPRGELLRRALLLGERMPSPEASGGNWETC